MSVNSKMTAIADKIRALLGLSGTMGMDAMSTNLATIQTDISGAFAAVRNKGGTIPTAKTSGNLASAINSITGGAEVRTATGTFTGKGTSGDIANINCGFAPDVLFIHLSDGYTEGGTPYLNDMAINLSALDVGDRAKGTSSIGEINNGSSKFVNGYITKTNSGFTPSSFLELSMNGDYAYTRKTYTYTAIKYT